MSKENLLVLHTRQTCDDASVWREAIRRSWKTVRAHPADPIAGKYENIRYYGNVLHAHMIKVAQPSFPVKFAELPSHYLNSLSFNNIINRKVQLMKYYRLVQPLQQDCFIRCTGIKWFNSKVYYKGESLPEGSLPDDYIYVQQIVEFEDEIRCFVVGDNIVTASYYRRNKIHKEDNADEDGVIGLLSYQIPKIRQFATLPYGVVLDFGSIRTSKSSRRWELIEANEAWAAGIYDCDPAGVFDAVIASQTNP